MMLAPRLKAPAANSSGISKEARRTRPIAPGLAISDAQFAKLIDTCRHLAATTGRPKN